MAKSSIFHRAALLLITLLAACGQQAPSATPGPTATLMPPVVAVTPATETPTVVVTPTQEQVATATAAVTPTVEATSTAELTPTATITPTEAVPLTNRAEFVADVTAPDGSVYKVNTPFLKTWRIKNVGTATWTPEYQLVFVKGEALTTTKSVPLTGTVGPGETIDISVMMTTPATTGRHQSFWQLRGVAGDLFGIGAEANVPIYADIWVVANQTGSNGPPIQVQSATLSVPQAAVTAPCPYELRLGGTLGTNKGAGRVTMQLDAVFTDPNYQYDAPDLVDLNFGGAEGSPFFIAYNLTFASSMSVQFQLHVLTPNDVRSAPINFTLTCSN